MSIVMPRRFSSSRRSASMPVSALTRAVLPWSMCPAVPTIMFFMAPAIILLLAGAAFAQQPAANDIVVFGAGVQLVKVDAQVVDDSGGVVSGAVAADFRVFDDGRPEKIAYCGTDAEPLDLLLLLDVSGSMHR